MEANHLEGMQGKQSRNFGRFLKIQDSTKVVVWFHTMSHLPSWYSAQHAPRSVVNSHKPLNQILKTSITVLKILILCSQMILWYENPRKY